ncbi:MAG: peptidyl-prolyl cis-trans isomerase [gamma proteobacterium endosymbiont of Lamellibrachia anaximandri]|nr:peptidyl-prolyl cis-trans isomerase [gamma proteobacterium endosymbiont of Lamellibrachia anaximandri]MBL3534763.1 peptidyl-prolyl cis-trans isomerase [gamma proteobacterium endosymbiont of Lamellibrachia anaximandri]
MKQLLIKTLLTLLLSGIFANIAAAETIRVMMETNQGNILLALDREKAPKTVDNFVQYVEDGFFNGTIFHRIIKGFMIQGGGFTSDMKKKETRDPVSNEAKNGLKNKRGSIAMARTGNPHSATAQFFINHKDNTPLDYPSFDGWGYAVFGEVVEGMDVVDSIASQPTGFKSGMPDVPNTPIVIEKVSVVK